MASKINKGEILAKFFDDGEYTALFADGAVSAACGYAAGQQAYAVYQNGEAFDSGFDEPYTFPYHLVTHQYKQNHIDYKSGHNHNHCVHEAD